MLGLTSLNRLGCLMKPGLVITSSFRNSVTILLVRASTLLRWLILFCILLRRSMSPALACISQRNHGLRQWQFQFFTLWFFLHPVHLVEASRVSMLKAILSAFVMIPHFLQCSSLSMAVSPLTSDGLLQRVLTFLSFI